MRIIHVNWTNFVKISQTTNQQKEIQCRPLESLTLILKILFNAKRNYLNLIKLNKLENIEVKQRLELEKNILNFRQKLLLIQANCYILNINKKYIEIN